LAVAVDGAGNVYIADSLNNRVRKVDAAGRLTTVAGNGNQDFSADGIPAASAALFSPLAVAVDTSGNLYFAEASRIRKVDAAGVITTVAGTIFSGFSGDDGPATSAQPDPFGVHLGLAVDSAGNLYLADIANHRIRKVDTAGIISTVAGNGTAGFSGDGGPAYTASLNNPTGVALDSAGDLYIPDMINLQFL